MARDTQPRKTPTMLAAEAAASATSALEQIARHERECSERYADVARELSALSTLTRAHSARWERTAWLVISTVLCAFIASVLKGYL